MVTRETKLTKRILALQCTHVNRVVYSRKTWEKYYSMNCPVCGKTVSAVGGGSLADIRTGMIIKHMLRHTLLELQQVCLLQALTQ